MKRLLISFLIGLLIVTGALAAQSGSELRFTMRGEPKTLHPLKVNDEPSETVRYLTSGALMRINRITQQIEPELAVRWSFLEQGRKMRLQLREGVKFSDGTPFTPEDVVFTFKTLFDPAVDSPPADTFRVGDKDTTAEVTGKNEVTLTFPAPIAGVERNFEQVSLLSAKSPEKEKAGLGPFVLAEHKPGSYLLLKRNPNYWKKDASGKQLPYLDAVRLEILANRDTELLRFQRGELHLINNLDADSYERLAAESSSLVRDLGPSLEGEQLWFNQVKTSPLAEYKKAWFRSTNFRRALAESINRHEMVKVVYKNHATPGVGPFSTANKFWNNFKLRAHPFDPAAALKRLEKDGFRKSGDTLQDREGHAVEFSVITNAGNVSRGRLAAMLQQDWKAIGVRLNVVTLDFPSIIERITRTYDYEACLLGLVNVDLDPNGEMNVWVSSAPNHQWNPSEKSPETPWEAEIDKLMQAQTTSMDPKKRKAAFDRVQEIVWEQAPFIYLVNRNALVGISPALKGVQASVLRPQIYWNVEYLSLAAK